MSKSRPRAFSYIRFSTMAQADGGSLDRQTELTEKYCQRKGLTLDDSLHLEDLGVSAFRGSNVREGALAGFLEACRIGRVPKGSFLIVESLDRLSRDQIRPALQLFLGLQDFGITIVTLQPEREYLPDDTDALTLIEPLIIFARSHEESLMKSHRRKDGWKRSRDKARQGGGPMLKTCPAWLEVTPDGFQVQEDRAKIVRHIYQLAREGLGVHRIRRRLTTAEIAPFGRRLSAEEMATHESQRMKDGVPLTKEEKQDLGASGRWTTFTVRTQGTNKKKKCRRWVRSKWLKAYVHRILTNPAAMGTYQPRRQEGKREVNDGEPVPGFYPAIVTEAEWREAQDALQSRDGAFERGGPGSAAAGRKGKDDHEANLFSGLIRHALTGQKMHLLHGKGRKVEGQPRKHYVYLAPSPETGEGGRYIDYHAFEYGIREKLNELKPSDIEAGPESANDRQVEQTRLSGRLLDLDSRIERAKARARKAEDFDAFLDLIESLQAERRQASERLDALRREKSSAVAVNLGEAQTLNELEEKAEGVERDELRRRMKLRIRQLITGIWVLVVPHGRNRLAAAQVFFASGLHRSYIIYHAPRVQAKPWVKSFAAATLPADLDLRKPKHAVQLADALELLSLQSLTETE
jgi:DNA invertase Pin-like site-specific DNA recombinase